jgi:predicted dehydrogenase
VIEEKVLLIGLGSIGQFHLEKLRSRYKHISVIEPNSQKHNAGINDLCSIDFYTSINQLKNLNLYKFAVIANWGPDHFKTIIDLRRAGIKKFIIEKPLCDSLLEVDRFEKLVNDKTITIISHLQWSYSYLPELINNYSSQDKLGSPISIVVNGGAKCLATNGIHLLALANVIFDDIPVEDSMLVKNDFINPRKTNFLFLEGNASWKYANSRYLSINFFNRSHNSLSILINFEYGLGMINNNKIKLYSITESDKIQLDKRTRTKEPSELLYEGEAFNFPDGSDGTDKIYKKIDGNIDIFDQLHLIQVTRSFLIALENYHKKSIFLNIRYFNLFRNRKKWKIS